MIKESTKRLVRRFFCLLLLVFYTTRQGMVKFSKSVTVGAGSTASIIHRILRKTVSQTKYSNTTLGRYWVTVCDAGQFEPAVGQCLVFALGISTWALHFAIY